LIQDSTNLTLGRRGVRGGVGLVAVRRAIDGVGRLHRRGRTRGVRLAVDLTVRRVVHRRGGGGHRGRGRLAVRRGGPRRGRRHSLGGAGRRGRRRDRLVHRRRHWGGRR